MNRFITLITVFSVLCSPCLRSSAQLVQQDEAKYLASFNDILAASYAAVDDANFGGAPTSLLQQCKRGSAPLINSSLVTTVQASQSSSTITSSQVSSQCAQNGICVIPSGVTVEMNSNLDVGALIIRGKLTWYDSTAPGNAFLCSGYVAVENDGIFDMNLQQKNGWIYIKDNNAVHHHLRSRSFGGVVPHDSNQNPKVYISGKKLDRTWSLLAKPLTIGQSTITLLHNPSLMKWSIGDRIAIASTVGYSSGFSQDFRIVNISSDGTITLNTGASHNFAADFVPPVVEGGEAALKSAEVVNLSRNIVITGDDYRHIPCDPNLPVDPANPGSQTSVEGCRCSTYRNTCTVGLHTAQMHGGVMQIQNARVEKCGQRGIQGKYCLHFHHLDSCENCLFKNNAVENGHQRGIIVHDTHLSKVEANVLYNIRGAGIYIEDGNEMYNDIMYNVVICPFPLDNPQLHGCTIPGTTNDQADTSINQSGIYAVGSTNNWIGNRCATHFNGMFLDAGGNGRGFSSGQVCSPNSKLGRYEGNVFHGHKRFGTYTLGGNFPRMTDQSISNDGHNSDFSLCSGFDNQGNTRGSSGVFKNHLDYGNVFNGHYDAGDIQHNGHSAHNSNNLIYWKTTKNFETGCSAHIVNGHYTYGNMALPDQGSFIIESTTFGNDVHLEPNHHCNVGVTGVLCMPQYILHNVNWNNGNSNMRWVTFQSGDLQGLGANQNQGGIFTLSPPDAKIVMDGGSLEGSFFPPGYVSLVHSTYNWLLSVPGNICVSSTSLFGNRYDNGILCKAPLRSLKVYSRGLTSSTAQQLKVQVWFNNQGLAGQVGTPTAEQLIGYHQIGQNGHTNKQGYSFPVIPGTDKSYKIMLANGIPIPSDWVIEFSDPVVGNRWGEEQIFLSVEGRNCANGGLVSDHHDRRFIWSGDVGNDGLTQAWGTHGACVAGTQPSDMPFMNCSSSSSQEGVIEATECPNLCSDACNNNAYCDCGTSTCRCKPGFGGADCQVDLCTAARCGDHGTCAARYLGGSMNLPVTKQACICDEGWSGPLCQYNPCQQKGLDCSGHGTCKALGDNDAICECNAGYSGANCESSCDGLCPGTYPFGCATQIPGIDKYGCHVNGGCNYLQPGQNYPYNGFCTYKDDSASSACACYSNDDCKVAGQCQNDGTCPDPTNVANGTPCNSVPWGECQNGTCISPEPSISPSLSPSVSPSSSPSVLPPPQAILIKSNLEGNFCLEPNSLLSGQPLRLRKCAKWNKKQHWYFNGDGIIQAKNNVNQCFSVTLSKLQIQSCTNDHRFHFNIFTKQLLWKENTNKAVAVPRNVGSNGKVVKVLASKKGARGQKWSLITV